MAHVMKSTKSSIGGLTRHYERFVKEDGKYVEFGNQDIDISKSHLNYNLAEHQNLSQLEFIKKRTSEVHCPNRKELNVMCSWVITKPKEITAAEEKQFFKESYKFLENRYGKDNIISSYVHLDETTPHMHFAFVPIIYDIKKEYHKVCAKDVVNRADLKTFHSDLSKSMSKIFKRDIGVINGNTIGGNKEIFQLKKETYEKELKMLDENFKQVKKINLSLDDIKKYEDKKPGITGKVAINGEEYAYLIESAKKGVLFSNTLKENKKLKSSLNKLTEKIERLEKNSKESILEKIQKNKELNELKNIEKAFQTLDLTIQTKALKSITKKIVKEITSDIER